MKNKLATLVAVVSVMTMSGLVYSAKKDSRNYELEKAVRLQTLSSLAINNGNYDLACKAQHEAKQSLERAGLIDVIEQADIVESEVCSWSWTSSITANS